VKNRRNRQKYAEFPIILPINSPSPKKDPGADGKSQNAIGGGIGNHPAIVPDVRRQTKHQRHRQKQGDNGNRQRQQQIPARPVLIDILDVQEIDAEGAEGLKQHQAHQCPVQL